MGKNEGRIELSIGEILYYLFFLSMLLVKGMGLYEGMKSYNICLLFAFVCVFFKLLLEKHTLLELSGIILMGVLGLIIYRVSGDKAPLIYICMIVGLKGISIVRIFKLGLPIWFMCMSVRTFMSLTGLEKGFVLAHEKLSLGPILRWSFGYPHPNVLQISYAVLAAFILYLSNKRGKELRKLLVLLFVGNCFVFLYAVSYTGFVLTSLLLFIFYYCVTRAKFSCCEKIIINAMLQFSVLFSIVGPLLTGEGMLLAGFDKLLNKILNMRFLASRIYLSQGITLFGENFSDSRLGFALDCSYVSLLMNDGIVLFSIVIVLYAGAVFYYLKSNKRKELAVILAFVITGISEPFLFNTSFKNLSLLFVGEFIIFQMAQYCEKHSDSILSTCIGIDLFPKKIMINMVGIYILKEKINRIWYEGKKRIILVCVSAGLLTACIYGVYNKAPETIYISVSNTDCPEREKYYLEMENLPEDFNSIVYEYQGKDVPLYKFDGNMIILERIRDIIGWWIIGSVFVGIMLIIYFILTDESKLKKERED